MKKIKEFYFSNIFSRQKIIICLTIIAIGVLIVTLLLTGCITQYEYDKKATELKQKQYELDERLKRITKADESYSITLITLLNLCSRAPELFESSKVEQKRQLINFLLSNLKLEAKN